MPLTNEEARRRRVCRICEKPILIPQGVPEDWSTDFMSRSYPPPKIIVKFGQEFAHETCLKQMEAEMAGFPSREKEEPSREKEEEETKKLEQSMKEFGTGLEKIEQLGSGQRYVEHMPSMKLLDFFQNPNPDRGYLITHDTKEFTSLCPKTGQPDFAEFKLTYIADQRCIESKSLKIYLFSFRNEGAFMETICNRICNDLVEVLKPRFLCVKMEFNARGGIKTSVTAEHHGEPQIGVPRLQPVLDEIKRLGDKIDGTIPKVQREYARVVGERYAELGEAGA